MVKLSEYQNAIVELVRNGCTTVDEIAKKMGKPTAIINAQLTRIRNAGQGHLVKGVVDRGVLGPKTETYTSSEDSYAPQSMGTQFTSNRQVVDDAARAGQAAYEIPQDLREKFQKQFGSETDVHPMVLLGVTIQFVKLVGGRIAAHHLIEQVHEALRAMVSDGTPKVGEEEWSAPWPLSAAEIELKELRKRNAELEVQLKSRKGR
jgi:hypothetical protein